MVKYTTIRLHPETWERCKHFGVFGDSQDDVINKVLDLAGKYTLITPPAPAVKEPQVEYKPEGDNGQHAT